MKRLKAKRYVQKEMPPRPALIEQEHWGLSEDKLTLSFVEKAASILATFRKAERNGMTSREILHMREMRTELWTEPQPQLQEELGKGFPPYWLYM